MSGLRMVLTVHTAEGEPFTVPVEIGDDYIMRFDLHDVPVADADRLRRAMTDPQARLVPQLMYDPTTGEDTPPPDGLPPTRAEAEQMIRDCDRMIRDRDHASDAAETVPATREDAEQIVRDAIDEMNGDCRICDVADWLADNYCDDCLDAICTLAAVTCGDCGTAKASECLGALCEAIEVLTPNEWVVRRPKRPRKTVNLRIVKPPKPT